MLRKTIVTIAAAAVIGAFAVTAASAAPGHHGGGRSAIHGKVWHGGHGGHGGYGLYRGYGFRTFAPLYASCWRWVPGRFGPVKVWVCG